jgi:hypothetical protein
MPSLRRQKPTDGSGTLATGQIRWKKTMLASPFLSVAAVRAWYLPLSPVGCWCSGAGQGSSAEAARVGCAHRDVAERRTAMDRGPTVT